MHWVVVDSGIAYQFCVQVELLFLVKVVGQEAVGLHLKASLLILFLLLHKKPYAVMNYTVDVILKITHQ